MDIYRHALNVTHGLIGMMEEQGAARIADCEVTLPAPTFDAMVREFDKTLSRIPLRPVGLESAEINGIKFRRIGKRPG